jgi:hypothetical protein
MKERCDNICETCSLQGQVYCALKFAKATNLSLVTLNERLESIEEMLQQNKEQILIDPLREPLDAGTGEDDKQI